MRRPPTLLAWAALLALAGAIDAAGCYRLSSDCDVGVTCPGYATTGSGGASTSSASSGGATSASTGGATASSATASSGTGGCTMVADCEDTNPCTHDACNAGVCAHTDDDAAIPDDMVQCTKDTCLSGVAHHDPEPIGTTCTMGVCDGAGACVLCAGAFGCKASEYCSGGACLSCSDGLHDGDETDVDCGGAHCPPCGLGKGCGVAGDCTVSSCVGGMCLGASCGNAVKDGTETDVDCGGPDCLPCAQGKGCTGGGDCVTGTCADGVCCATACNGAADTCKSCAIPGQQGTCSALPQGVDDAVCLMQATCDVGAQCVSATGKAHFGDPCTQGSDCFNGACRAGSCKLQNGDACAEDAACVSGRCSGNTCASCAAGAECASGTCNAGACSLPGGFLCTNNADCATLQCVNGACNGSGACAPATCVTHFCKNMACQTCSTSADCPLNTPCTGGTCLAPPGAYCSQNARCASGVCLPAIFLGVRRCQ